MLYSIIKKYDTNHHLCGVGMICKCKKKKCLNVSLYAHQGCTDQNIVKTELF